MRQRVVNGLSMLFVFMSLFVFSACGGSENEEKDTTLDNAVVGLWCYSKDNYIYSLNVKKDGTGTLTTYKYESKQWTETTSALQYVISGNMVAVRLQDEDAWSGALAVTGNSMSITKDSDVFMFTGFDGNVETLKTEIEENWIEEEPTNTTIEESYYQSEEDVKAALDALYSSLRTYEYNQLNLESIRIYGYDLNDNPKQITPQSSEVYSTWQAAYKAISVANNIVNALQDKAEYKAYMNEALAIRSLVYYNIANLWGTIPYITDNDEAVLYNPSIYTCKQVVGEVKNTLSSLDTFTNENYHINAEMVNALLGEIALCEGDKAEALKRLDDCAADFSVYVNADSEPDIYKQFGEKIPNYTSDIIGLLKKEAESDTADIVSQWQSLGSHTWGYWLMLKRTGNAITVSGCQDYELLMPIPESELAVNPTLTQNPGY